MGLMDRIRNFKDLIFFRVDSHVVYTPLGEYRSGNQR
jgi:hypothetical protein